MTQEDLLSDLELAYFSSLLVFVKMWFVGFWLYFFPVLFVTLSTIWKREDSELRDGRVPTRT